MKKDRVLKKTIKSIFENIILILVSLLIGFSIKTYVFERVQVSGMSMYPTYEDKQHIWITKIDSSYKHNEIVVFQSHDNDNSLYIKRVIGLPNDHVVIKNEKIFVNDIEQEQNYIPKNIKTLGDVDLIVPNDDYYVLGDNRTNSIDSRIIGPISKDSIIGKVL